MTRLHRLFPLLLALVVVLPAMAQVDDYRDIEFKKLPPFKIPSPEVFKLDNGMTVFLMEDHELPLISVRATIRTGSNYEPVEKAGLAGIFGQVQREGGTTSMSGDEIDDFLEARAASVETFIGSESGGASMNGLKEDFDEVFALFNDVLRNPAFAEDKIELAKQQARTGIARRNDDVSGIAGREFSRIIYGRDSPLSALPEYATIASIQRDDLVAWHEKYYHPNNVYLGVLGDFDPKQMRAKIEKAYADWKKGPETALPEIPYATDVAGIYFIPKDDVTQAQIRMGHLGITMDNPDYFAVQVMNNVLSGGFASRLFSRIRSDQGLAYNVGGGIGASFRRPGAFAASMSTKSESTAEAVASLRKELAGMISEPATDEEIKRAKESILNSFIFNYDTASKVLGQQMSYAYYGLPSDFLETYREKIEQVSAADVARVAKKYIRPDELAILVVGNAADFDAPLSTFGEVQEIDIAIAPPPSSAPEVVKSASNVAAGREILARAAKSMAGEGELDSMTVDYDVALTFQGQEIAIGQALTIDLPSKMRQTVRSPFGEQVVVINGEQGFAEQGGQRQPLPAPMIAQSWESVWRDPLVLVAAGAKGQVEAVAAGEGDGCAMVAVELKSVESRLCVDPAGRVVRQIYQGKHPLTQTPGEIEIAFTDFESIDGRQVPRTRVMHFDGSKLATMTMKSFEANGTLDAALFAIE